MTEFDKDMGALKDAAFLQRTGRGMATMHLEGIIRGLQKENDRLRIELGRTNAILKDFTEEWEEAGK